MAGILCPVGTRRKTPISILLWTHSVVSVLMGKRTSEIKLPLLQRIEVRERRLDELRRQPHDGQCYLVGRECLLLLYYFFSFPK